MVLAPVASCASEDVMGVVVFSELVELLLVLELVLRSFSCPAVIGTFTAVGNTEPLSVAVLVPPLLTPLPVAVPSQTA